MPPLSRFEARGLDGPATPSSPLTTAFFARLFFALTVVSPSAPSGLTVTFRTRLTTGLGLSGDGMMDDRFDFVGETSDSGRLNVALALVDAVTCEK